MLDKQLPRATEVQLPARHHPSPVLSHPTAGSSALMSLLLTSFSCVKVKETCKVLGSNPASSIFYPVLSHCLTELYVSHWQDQEANYGPTDQVGCKNIPETSAAKCFYHVLIL